ncbi:protein lin-37 homolog [Anopheles marshallii]|uniref:protein lin-37 homolog n=1 Tax=Anopheles marshallii TaxID=1521116 RepID=UPI00237A527D|nr:protein lin-37 homolog [Anopheles marshallii]
MLAKRRSLINSDEKRKALQNVVLARGRLKGALKTVSKSSDDSTGDDDSDEESQMKRKRLEPPTVYQPYIINLFNRGIDVARFRENSPLYPMCRAWVKNNPRQKIEETISASATKPRVAIKREHNPDIVSQLANGELHEIKEMPRPATTSMEPFLVIKPQPADDFDIDKSSQSKDEILSEHLVNWKKLRESNITHRKQYEQARFGTSFKLLEALKK